jgi:L-lactate dehydrogenase complex protein LldE
MLPRRENRESSRVPEERLRVRVALFVTCLVDQIYPDVGVATVRLLRRLGCEVEFPRAQACCGQPFWNSGLAGEARDVAATLLDAFEGYDHVVTPSGSCAAMIVRHYAEVFHGDPIRAERARALAARTRELSQFLVHVLGVDDVGARFPHRVTWHPSCHALRGLALVDEPLRLLRNVRELELVPLVRAEDCCGFGGVFAAKYGGISGAMAAEKCEHVEGTRAAYLAGSDMGCLMNIQGALSRRGASVKAVHLAQILEGSLGSEH